MVRRHLGWTRNLHDALEPVSIFPAQGQCYMRFRVELTTRSGDPKSIKSGPFYRAGWFIHNAGQCYVRFRAGPKADQAQIRAPNRAYEFADPSACIEHPSNKGHFSPKGSAEAIRPTKGLVEQRLATGGLVDPSSVCRFGCGACVKGC